MRGRQKNIYRFNKFTVYLETQNLKKQRLNVKQIERETERQRERENTVVEVKGEGCSTGLIYFVCICKEASIWHGKKPSTL